MSGKKALHDEMVAISKNIQNEIKELYLRKSKIILFKNKTKFLELLLNSVI